MKFGSDMDEAVYNMSLDGLAYHLQVGDVETCQWEARVDFDESDDMGEYVGAIVTVDDEGSVWVDYFADAQVLKAVFQDIVNGHGHCCLYAEDMAA